MGKHYTQLSLKERIEIYRLLANGESLRKIASYIRRAPSTVAREIKRNSKSTKIWKCGYCPERADKLACRRRRWDCRFKLARQPDLRELVRNQLAMGWSPEQIAGRLALKQAHMQISHESIYRFVYHRSDQKDYWHRLLPKRKSRRGRLGKRGGSPVQRIRDRRPVHDRPAEAETRQSPGHWETDLMLFRKYGQAVLITHERCSRLLLAARQPSKQAKPVLEKLIDMLKMFPEPMRKTMTFDNGTEFALHYKLNRKLGIKTSFCDPHAPWQKGGVENAISRLRRKLPRKSDLAAISQKQLDDMVASYNATPRKCLGFRTPAEVFNEKIKNVALQT